MRIFFKEIYEVWDTIAYFDGVVNNHFTNLTETIVPDGVRLTVSTQNNCVFKKGDTQLFIPTNNDFCIEFDIINSNNFALYLIKANNTRYKQIGSEIHQTSVFKNHKFKYSNGQVKMYEDDVLKLTTDNVSITDVDNVGFCFVDWQADMDCTIKNLRIYPI